MTDMSFRTIDLPEIRDLMVALWRFNTHVASTVTVAEVKIWREGKVIATLDAPDGIATRFIFGEDAPA